MELRGDITFLQRQIIWINQALLGVISSNFRMVSLNIKNNHVTIEVILEKESVEDMNELQEFLSLLYILEPDNIDIELQVKVFNGSLYLSKATDQGATVYKRREI